MKFYIMMLSILSWFTPAIGSQSADPFIKDILGKDYYAPSVDSMMNKIAEKHR